MFLKKIFLFTISFGVSLKQGIYKKSLKVGIVEKAFYDDFCEVKILKILMIYNYSVSQIKWMLLVLAISFVLVISFESIALDSDTLFKAQNTFLGLNLFLEILIFFAFSTFVVFGIKGFFEMYSQKISNVITITSGVILTIVIFILCYQILIPD